MSQEEDPREFADSILEQYNKEEKQYIVQSLYPILKRSLDSMLQDAKRHGRFGNKVRNVSSASRSRQTVEQGRNERLFKSVLENNH